MGSRSTIFRAAATMVFAISMLFSIQAYAVTPTELAAQIYEASQSETDPASAIQAVIDASELETADVAYALGLAQTMGADAALVAEALNALQLANIDQLSVITTAFNDGAESRAVGGFSPASRGGFQGEFSGVGGGQDNPSPN